MVPEEWGAVAACLMGDSWPLPTTTLLARGAMAGRHRGVPIFWTPQRVIRMRRYAERGFSQREAALCLGTTHAAVAIQASKLGIHFHALPGAPPLNRNNL